MLDIHIAYISKKEFLDKKVKLWNFNGLLDHTS